MNIKPRFFLGANSENGFVSYFKQLQEQDRSMQLLILKGGPGSGKSTLMKKVLRFAEEKGHILEIIPCASDPDSLDAFIDYTAGFSMMDGTSPHTEDPTIPGARHHILYTGALWDSRKLSEKYDEIKKLTDDVGACHKGATSYIRAAASLLSENKQYAKDFLRKKETIDFAEKVISHLSGGKSGVETKRLLSAVSVGEIKQFTDTVSFYADKIYIIEDSFGAASDFIMKTVAFSARLKGENYIYCPCSVMPDKCDHLIFPESRTALVTKNNFLDFSKGETVSGFYNDMPFESDMKKRLGLAQKLLSQGCALVKKAKNIHDDLEAYYKDAMCFENFDDLFRDITERFYV